MIKLSRREMAVVQALCFYAPDDMTGGAKKTIDKLRKRIEKKHAGAVEEFRVWEE